jgi:hypothetical protein
MAAYLNYSSLVCKLRRVPSFRNENSILCSASLSSLLTNIRLPKTVKID